MCGRALPFRRSSSHVKEAAPPKPLFETQPLTSKPGLRKGRVFPHIRWQSQALTCVSHAKVTQTMWKFASPIKHPIPETRWPSSHEAARSLLFQPIEIGSLELENRTWV